MRKIPVPSTRPPSTDPRVLRSSFGGPGGVRPPRRPCRGWLWGTVERFDLGRARGGASRDQKPSISRVEVFVTIFLRPKTEVVECLLYGRVPPFRPSTTSYLRPCILLSTRVTLFPTLVAPERRGARGERPRDKGSKVLQITHGRLPRRALRPESRPHPRSHPLRLARSRPTLPAGTARRARISENSTGAPVPSS